MSRKMTIPVDSSPEHAQAIGRVTAHWSVVEATLCAILTKMLKVQQLVGEAVFYSVVNNQARREMIHNVAAHVLLPDEQAALKSLLGRTKRLNSRRNRIAHDLWGSGRDGALTQVKTTPSEKVFASVTAKEINRLADDIATLCHDLTMFRVGLYKMHGA